MSDDLNRKHAIFIKKKIFDFERERKKNVETRRREEKRFQTQEMIIIKFPFI